ncbi:MAG: trigger factor [Chloroflexi bacterium RBG_13_52_14]|nr:MAG: trigger factor [Chloroflexi bacterium RBG_13_52_14]
MKATTEKIEGSRVVLNIETDNEEMEKSLEKAYRRLAAKTAVPGFRKGKAPRPMLERYLGREALVEEAANLLLVETYDKAIEEHKVEAIARPEVEVIQIEPLSFKATVPVRPTVELGDYHDIKFVPEQVEITEEEVNEALERLRNMRSTWEPVEREAKLDDLLNIDVEGTAQDKVVVSEKGGWYVISANPNAPFPGLSKELEGAKKDEERAFTLKLPESFKESAGQDCSFKVKVNEVKQRNLPNLDDEFAKSLGKGVDTLDVLKERIKSDLKSAKERLARGRLEEKAIDALVAISRLEYPDIMVQNEIDHLIEERRQYQGGEGSLEDYLKNAKKTEEEFRNELKPAAEGVIKRSLVLAKLGEMEKVEVGAADIDAEIERVVQNSNNDERVRQVFSSPTARESLGRNIYIRKAIDRLAEIATKNEEATPPVEKEGGKENGEATQ